MDTLTLCLFAIYFLIAALCVVVWTLHTIRQELSRNRRAIVSLQLQCLALASAICPDREQITGEVPQTGALQ